MIVVEGIEMSVNNGKVPVTYRPPGSFQNSLQLSGFWSLVTSNLITVYHRIVEYLTTRERRMKASDQTTKDGKPRLSL